MILLSGITVESCYMQVKAAEKLLANCLAIMYPQLIANRKEPEGFWYSVDCMGCVYWIPIRYTGDATVLLMYGRLLMPPSSQKRKLSAAQIWVIDLITPPRWMQLSATKRCRL